METLQIDSSWSLFLDRDGVINKKLDNDYVKTPEEFELLPGVKETLNTFRKQFARILIVTNQQGIGKGLMTEQDLEKVHKFMRELTEENNEIFDRIYFCPELAQHNPECRKPNTGMGLKAKQDFPEIDFAKSVMVGDSLSDMEFGKRLGMKTVFIGDKEKTKGNSQIDFCFVSLEETKALLELV